MSLGLEAVLVGLHYINALADGDAVLVDLTARVIISVDKIVLSNSSLSHLIVLIPASPVVLSSKQTNFSPH